MALSFADAVDLWKDAVNLLEKTERYGHTTSPEYTTLYAAVVAENLGDYSEQVAAAIRRHRAILSSMLHPAQVRDILRGPMNEIAAAINAPERDDLAAILFRLREYMLAQSPDETLNAREFSRGTPSAGGANVGNGNLRRLTVDEDAYPLEASHVETKTFECVADQNTVDKHQEVFEFRGAKPEIDLVNVVGSGIRGQLRALSTRQSQDLLVNPTYSQFNGTQPTAGSESTPAATTSVTGWTLTTAANARVSIDLAYRDLIGETKTFSLRFTDNNKVVQAIAAQRRARLSTKIPYYVQVAVYRKDACDGTLTIRWGAGSQAFTMSSLSDNAWNIVRLDADKDLYYKNFKEDTLTIEAELGSRTTGSLYLDDWIVAPWTFVDGSYWALVGGATPFIVKDTFTAADTASATRGVLQYWTGFRSGLSFSLPAVTGAAETIADPT